MRRRFLKELSGLRPYWVGLLVLELIGWIAIKAGPLHLPSIADPNALSRVTPEQIPLLSSSFLAWYVGICSVLGIVQAIVFHLISAGIFGWEFDGQTIGRLLAQPISRSRIWTEKILALILIMSIVLVGNMLLSLGMLSGFRHLNSMFPQMHLKIRDYMGDIVQPWAVFTLCVSLLALASGPLMALLLRQTHTAFWAAMVLPIFMAAVMGGIDYVMILPLSGFSITDRLNAASYKVFGAPHLMVLFTLVWFPIPYFLGWLTFKRLEV